MTRPVHPGRPERTQAKAGQSGSASRNEGQEVAEADNEEIIGRLKVVVVGQGYVGLPLAMRAVEVGYRVVGSTSTSTGSSG